MKLADCIPYQVCVNMASREDRRKDVWRRFAQAGLSVDRQPGVPKEWVRDTRGFMNPSRYACSLAKRLAIRRGKLAGAPAVLLFEDDVILASDLHERLEEIELPPDWGIFFLGCKHLKRPEIIARGIVRVRQAADHHAMAVRAEYVHDVFRGIAGYGKGAPRSIPYSDVKMSAIQDRVPTYAAFPNLAWQASSHSDNSGHKGSAYDDLGRQIYRRDMIEGLEREMLEWEKGSDFGPKVNTDGEGAGDTLRHGAFHSVESASDRVFPANGELAEGDNIAVVNAVPEFPELSLMPIARKFEEAYPLRFFINLGRREDRRFDVEYQFAIQNLQVERLPAADGRNARRTRGHGAAAQYACRLSHRMAIRNARLRKAPTVFICEDDLVLHRDFRRIVEVLSPPEDWGVLFFGCIHVSPPVVAAPWWLRVSDVWGLHSYAVREKWYARILRELRAPGCGGLSEGADVVLSKLSGDIPMYAIYPNIAWQTGGYSDIRQTTRESRFGGGGHQIQQQKVLRHCNVEMRRIIGHQQAPPPSP